MEISQEIIDKADKKANGYNFTSIYEWGAYKQGIIDGYQLRDDEVTELKKKFEATNAALCKRNRFLTAELRLSDENGFVWDYSDIAIKFKHWIPEKEFENENAAFTFFFQEVYNKDFR